MEEIQLDPRLACLADMVRPGSVVADIGTDHAYLICTLVARGVCPRGYACDINPQPLERAAATIKAHGLVDKITTRLTNGLQGLPLSHIDDVVIAGMGGDLIGEILLAEPTVRDEHKRFLLQPMTKADHLRRALYPAGFEITEERAAVSGRFVYTAMAVRYGGAPRQIDDIFAFTGKLWEQTDPASARYLEQVAAELTKKADGLQRSAAQAADALPYRFLADIIRNRGNNTSDI